MLIKNVEGKNEGVPCWGLKGKEASDSHALMLPSLKRVGKGKKKKAGIFACWGRRRLIETIYMGIEGILPFLFCEV